MSRKFKDSDPHFEREAKKYAQPVPSREYILEYLTELGCPTTEKQLIKAFKLTDEDQIEGIRRRLKAMLRDGQLMLDRRRRYCLIDKLELIAGRVVGHPDGFGFVVPDDGSTQLYLPSRQMCRVLHGDRVLVRALEHQRKGRLEASLYEVTERNTKQVVGRLFKEAGVTFVEPDNKRISQTILIAKEDLAKSKEGQMVVVDIVQQPTLRSQPIGRIVEVLGEPMDPGMEIDVAIRSYELPHDWSIEIQKELASIETEVTEEALQGRKDLTALPFVTIDGADAKDFDDAVYCEATSSGGWCLRVAIADVSHYVKPNSFLDQEAVSRGNSVYFPGRTVPMLPEILSNGLCSLQPNVKRLAMVCEMMVDSDGNVKKYQFYESVICSQARLTYQQTADILIKKDSDLQKTFSHVLDNLNQLYALYHELHKQRRVRGAIEFDLPETRIVFDDDKKISEILAVERNDAHKLIEECMLLANVCAAKWVHQHKIPALYRIHPPPREEKVTGVRELLKELGLQLPGGDPVSAKAYCQLLENVAGRRDKHLIQVSLLLSLSQADYAPVTEGHFGLAYKLYAHFTSPIRRYPDLLLHRAIRHIIQGKPVETFAYQLPDMKKLGLQCSMTERRADDATRNAVNWLKCEYMLDKIGQQFSGMISSVTEFGLFIQLDQIYVEGLVHITSLPNDYYLYHAKHHRLVGERTGKKYQLGQPLTVELVRVNLDDRKIDFELIDDD